ncbi:MAG: hypothetical protein V7K37_05890 [Nostoc sp.]
MSTLGSMVADVAHEINNPVGFIAANLTPAKEYIDNLLYLIDLYQQTYPKTSQQIQETIEMIDLEYVREDLPKLISSMREGTDRISNISNSLRTFSRADTEQKFCLIFMKVLTVLSSFSSTVYKLIRFVLLFK